MDKIVQIRKHEAELNDFRQIIVDPTAFGFSQLETKLK
jgi:hypothetical protein